MSFQVAKKSKEHICDQFPHPGVQPNWLHVWPAVVGRERFRRMRGGRGAQNRKINGL